MQHCTQHFSENENQDHADEQTRLLGCAADTGVTDDADGETARVSNIWN